MELYLIRHGQAEERAVDRPDEARSLTQEGRRRLQESMSGYGVFLQGQRQLVLWSSPQARAQQTADMIAQFLGIKKVRAFDFIGSGDFEAFSAAMAEMPPASCVVLVGHQPYLGEWSQRICGLALPFKKGAIAGFQLDSESGAPVHGELLCFAQPALLRRVGEE